MSYTGHLMGTKISWNEMRIVVGRSTNLYFNPQVTISLRNLILIASGGTKLEILNTVLESGKVKWEDFWDFCKGFSSRNRNNKNKLA